MGDRTMAPETVESETSLDDLSQDIIDIAEQVELIVEQNKRILQRLNEERDIEVSGAAAFWDAAFSIWGLLIVLAICAAITQIFSGQPLLK